MTTDRRRSRCRRAFPPAEARLPRRALSLIELLLAMAVTAMVAAAIAAMWTAITVGESTRRDNRAFMVRTYAAKARISAYVAPSRCVLFADQHMLVLWRDDSRESGSVHASEIRWLVFDDVRGELNVYFVKFPAALTEVDKALRDSECALSTNWSALLSNQVTASLAAKLTLVDGLQSVSMSLDEPAALDARAVTCQLGFSTETAGQIVSQTLTAAIMAHVTPEAP